MHQTTTLQRLASTHHGMRKILKQRPSTVQYIKWAIETGIHKDLHPEDDTKKPWLQTKPKPTTFAKYPFAYEVLTQNPPLPQPPRIPLKDLRRQKKALPTDKLVKDYMRRYDARMQAARSLTDAEREEYQYYKTLGVSNPASTAMGRKSAVLSHAYEFALKQFETMQNNDNMTEDESIAVVEDLLASEERIEMLNSRKKVNALRKQRSEEKKEHMEAVGRSKENQDDGKGASTSASTAAADVPPPAFTIPSILHSKPRTIRALNIWGRRLQAVPYNQWTLGASTALDHWIAVDVLGMSEGTWNRLLSGELEVDIEKSRGADVTIGDLARNKDIVAVRSTLFPETILAGIQGDDSGVSDEIVAELLDDEKDATERSIDELLASLGGFEDDDDAMNTHPSDDPKQDPATWANTVMDTLQDWRAKNEETPYDEWDDAAKGQFNEWMHKDYLALVSEDTDGDIDIKETREALLSEPPSYRDENDKFWAQITDEADAEILLNNLSKESRLPPSEGEESASAKRARESLEIFLNMPYSKQLSQITNLGTLRPILDEYASKADYKKFMQRHGETLLEGMEIEHLVSDPNGHIVAEDIEDKSLLDRKTTKKDERFSIKLVPYGTDEFGLPRSERARSLFRAWNVQKSGRARYAEYLYKTGKMPLAEARKRHRKRRFF